MPGVFLIYIAVLVRISSNPFGNVFQKQLTVTGKHPLVVNFATYFLLSAGSLFIAAIIHWPLLSVQFWFYSILGGITGALGNGFLVKALQNGELSVLGPINSYKSVIGIIGGIILLKEIPNFWGLLGIFLIICGSYFVLDTSNEKFSLALFKRPEIQYRFLAMILSAIEAVFIKKVIIASSPAIAFISWCFFGAIFSFILLYIYKLNLMAEARRINKTDIGKFMVLIICIGSMQFTTSFIFKYLPVGYALSLFQLSSILSVMLGFKVFKELNIGKKLIGSVIMIIGSIIIILLKNQ